MFYCADSGFQKFVEKEIKKWKQVNSGASSLKLWHYDITLKDFTYNINKWNIKPMFYLLSEESNLLVKSVISFVIISIVTCIKCYK
jgi:hypothetical protein